MKSTGIPSIDCGACGGSGIGGTGVCPRCNGTGQISVLAPPSDDELADLDQARVQFIGGSLHEQVKIVHSPRPGWRYVATTGERYTFSGTSGRYELDAA